MTKTRLVTTAFLTAVLTLGLTAPAFACGGLVAPNGAISLLRTTTLAGYRNGIEHYVTSFEFAGGGGGKFGSIVPLPDVPTRVIRGGDWTLQRLQQEVQPPVAPTFFAADAPAEASASPMAEVLLKTQIDALDITILKGGGTAVGNWAREHGFELTPDAPELLDFYASRSPIFAAAQFDAQAADELGQQAGDSTPIHFVIPTDRPWVPLRILSLGRAPDELVEADVFLLTPDEPNLLPKIETGLSIERSENSSELLTSDLRSDSNMKWVDGDGMWLTFLKIDSTAKDLTYDLAIDPTGTREPSPVDAGLAAPAAKTAGAEAGPSLAWTKWLMAALIALIAFAVVKRRARAGTGTGTDGMRPAA